MLHAGPGCITWLPGLAGFPGYPGFPDLAIILLTYRIPHTTVELPTLGHHYYLANKLGSRCGSLLTLLPQCPPPVSLDQSFPPPSPKESGNRASKKPDTVKDRQRKKIQTLNVSPIFNGKSGVPLFVPPAMLDARPSSRAPKILNTSPRPSESTIHVCRFNP